MFVCKNNVDTIYIIPVLGKGLWGPLWGYVALKNDYNTIVGVVFDHKGETPGLGAEIATPTFQKQFSGKKIFDDNENFVSVSVVKGGVANSGISAEYGVDAISGGTITSNGLANMLKICLANYEKYFKNRREEIFKCLEPVVDSIVEDSLTELHKMPSYTIDGKLINHSGKLIEETPEVVHSPVPLDVEPIEKPEEESGNVVEE
jgi:hypothetical protein